MKVPVCMLLGLFFSILIMDVAVVWAVRDKIIIATELSLDAALVVGVNEKDLLSGEVNINEKEGYYAAITMFKENLKLNNKLENSKLKDTKFTVQFKQTGERPRVEAYIETYITTVSPKVLGVPGIPVKIHKIQHHLGKYN